MKKFPEGFHWGAATASYQVEGGIENTDWALAADEGRVPEAGLSSDHYHKYQEDFDIARELGHTAHRFSVEWARIEPEEGKFNYEAIQHYRSVLEALSKRGIKPYITLWHFTLPQWFAERGGFERKDSIEIFARYCTYVVRELGDMCSDFSTMNEPNVFASHGWLFGAWPPFKRGRILWIALGKPDGTSSSAQTLLFANVLTYFQVVKNLIRAHNAAYKSIKEAVPHCGVSIVKHVRVFQSNGNPFNRLLAIVARYLQSGYFLNRVCRNLDSIGLNYYRNTKFGETQAYRKTDMGWNFYPEGIEYALLYLKKYNKPIYVSEAGIADKDDSDRAEYITKQVEATWRAIQAGADVRGHMYWSLLDNYEWALGYEKRFGLVEIDYKTLARKIRPSAYVYKKIIDANGLE